MHEKIMQAKRSHSEIYLEQRTDPHYLVPEKPTEFAFERANPNDKHLSLLQRCATYLSVKDLLDEADDITHLMSTVHNATEVDMPIMRAKTHQSAHQKCARSMKSPMEMMQVSVRTIVSCIYEGHKVHPSKVQRMNSTSNFSNKVFQNNPDLMN
jgi:hypothetical protein